VKQTIRRPSTVLLITLGVNLIFCPVIASFPLIKGRTSQRYSFSVSVQAASKKISLKVKTTKITISLNAGLCDFCIQKFELQRLKIYFQNRAGSTLLLRL
jgi:hypothetical protein